MRPFTVELEPTNGELRPSGPIPGYSFVEGYSSHLGVGNDTSLITRLAEVSLCLFLVYLTFFVYSSVFL